MLISKLYYKWSEHKYIKITQFESLKEKQVWHLQKSCDYSLLILCVDGDFADKLLELSFIV